MATLKKLVNETTNIKNELKTCYTNLKNNLIAKGIECSNTDKMFNLISKINNIVVGDNVIVGETIQLFNYTSAGAINIKKGDVFKITSNVNGSIKIKINYISSTVGSTSSLNIDLVREDSIVSSKTFTLNKYGSYIVIEYDLTDIKLNDVISIYSPNSNGAITKATGSIVVTCDKL